MAVAVWNGAGSRIGTAIVPAMGASIALFVLMQGMIKVEGGPVSVKDTPEFQVVSDRVDTPVEPTGSRSVNHLSIFYPPRPARLDVTLDVEPSPNPNANGTGFSTVKPPVADPVIETFVPVVNIQPTPVVRGEQRYPAPMIRRDIEGNCTMAFDITTAGTTTNIRVAHCTHTGFAKAAIQAVERYRYTPVVGETSDPIAWRDARIELVWQLGE